MVWSISYISVIPTYSGKEDVTFKSGNTTLAGTIQIPKGKGPFPAVVFLHGSGPSDRNESKQRANWFLKRGYVTLTYDKRGVGASQGSEADWRYYSFDTLAADGAAALRYLSARPEVNTEKLGLVAASQSGWIAPLVARNFENLNFMIVISASVTTVAEDNLFERGRRLKMEGFSDEDIAEVYEMHMVDNQVSRNGEQFDKFSELWEMHKNKPWFRRVYLGEQPMAVDHAYRQWYRQVMDFDPVQILGLIDIPVLWLYGDAHLDRFGPVAESIRRLEALKESGKTYTIRQYSQADHNLKGADYRDPMFDWLHHLSP